MNSFRRRSTYILLCWLWVVPNALLAASPELKVRPPLKFEIQRFPAQPESEFPAAVRVSSTSYAYTTQLLPEIDSQEVEVQCAEVLNRLDRVLHILGSERKLIVQLNGYVVNREVRQQLQEQLIKWTGGERPAITWTVTPLPDPRALVGLDAVVIPRKNIPREAPLLQSIANEVGNSTTSHVSVLPVGDVVYISGQAEPGDLETATSATLESLLKTLHSQNLDSFNIAHIKCFVTPMTEISVVNKQIEKFFKGTRIPPVTHIEWVSGSRPIEIELVAWGAPLASVDTVTYATPPHMSSSPVYSRLARIHGNERIYISGLVASETGTGEAQVVDIFAILKQTLEATGSDLRHLAKATYYVSETDASNQLNLLRPNYFDPTRPPAASKAMVQSLAESDRGITIEMIAVPTP